jgi:hypothetical protein
MTTVDDDTMSRIINHIESTTKLLWWMRVWFPLLGAGGLLTGFLFGRITLICQ